MPTERLRRGPATAVMLALCATAGLAGVARAEDPLSAIDWLSQSVTPPAGTTAGQAAPPAPAPDAGATVAATVAAPVSQPGAALPAPVATTPLDGPNADAVGLVPPAVSGLPRTLWGAGRTAEIAAAITAEQVEQLPALRQLFLTLLLAEAEPPADSGGEGRLLLARVDKLLALGAVEQAAALMDAAGITSPEVFRRAFDVALLTGREDRACEAMLDFPNLAPTFPARIFCLARSGDWNAAALTLRTAQALGLMSDVEDALLSRFLDPDLYEGDPLPPAPSPLTPLVWKMYEAIGEPRPTAGLPLAFSHAELGPQSGWKAQIEAAERLTRAGVVAPNQILGLYTERQAAASGGVWDRVDAFAEFDAALMAGDVARISQTLPVVWARMTEAELEVPFAALYGRSLALRLAEDGLTPEARAIAFRVGLLSPVFAQVAEAHRPADPAEAFLRSLALGRPAEATAPNGVGRAIVPAFSTPQPSETQKALVDAGRPGEAILSAIDSIGRGVQGDLRGVTEGLSLLRALRLEDAARRTALELMILERRG